jgi:Nucleoside-diphosphate-sugar pyrophosphorylase involved in lipopolysaccharide biosynthesis/translation initiation factor 2B, gamma/epsilon subunits (eIF-2Bgamma/eIF-2Bepsilon)
MSFSPTHAMVLAAGLGLRMRPITETIPKPLVEVAGRTMLDRALDHLAAAGVGHLVVNTHWLAGKVAAHLAGRPDVTLSHEDELLETGGGVARALPHLGARPFYVVNSDIVWTDGATPALKRLADAWDDARMDGLLLLQRTATAVGYEGAGDFFLDPQGVPRRRRDREVAPLLFSGVQILSPRLFREAPGGKFSLNVLYDRALEDGRLYGIVHDGRWYHVGTPDALPRVEAALKAADDRTLT